MDPTVQALVIPRDNPRGNGKARCVHSRVAWVPKSISSAREVGSRERAGSLWRVEDASTMLAGLRIAPAGFGLDSSQPRGVALAMKLLRIAMLSLNQY